MEEDRTNCPFEKYCKVILKKNPIDPIFVNKGQPLGDFLDGLELACRTKKRQGLDCYANNPECGVNPDNWKHLSAGIKFLVSIHTEPLGDI